MRAQFLLGDASGRFRDASEQAGHPWPVPRLGRELAVGDMDNDGRVDVLINPSSMNKPGDAAGGKDAPKPGLLGPLRPN